MSECPVPGDTALLGPDQWRPRAAAHQRRVRTFLAGHRGPHPVWDFLFRYYGIRPGALLCWHAGYGFTLGGDQARRRYLGRTGYIGNPEGVTVSPAYLQRRHETVRFVGGLLDVTANRPAQFNCFGMHEWAMVYRSAEVRHRTVPLRLGPAATDAVVESTPLRCSHFDAFRFFSADAAPRNAVALTRRDQPQHEQPGCVHANMDLYKWCAKLGPLVDSGLLMDCLELAADARELDMRAGPYDLTGYGFRPIEVEQPAGRAQYVRRQTEIARRAAALRTALLGRCRSLVDIHQRDKAVVDQGTDRATSGDTGHRYPEATLLNGRID